MNVVEFENGIAINGEFGSDEVRNKLTELPKFPLIVADPPYGNILPDKWDRVIESDIEFSEWMFYIANEMVDICLPGSAAYIWGGIGTPNFRPFYRFCADVENETPWSLANHITWKKRRAYGISHNYLFTREECAMLILGNPKKPRKFNIPLLDEKRGYAGYNPLYPAKSEFYRRSNVWTDINELFRDKVHPAQKPTTLAEIMIATHTDPGETVLDPFAGSGSTAFAARSLGRKWVLIEKDPVIFSIMVARLKHEKTPESSQLPSDYEACGECGFDHSYDYESAAEFHFPKVSK